jgi:tetratricopeptide (TPR) repeat protein
MSTPASDAAAPPILCQVCGAENALDAEVCVKCGSKLMVVSGPPTELDDVSDEVFVEAQEDLEEHILERLTALEDGLRRLSEAVAAAAEHIGQLEHNLMVTHSGVQAVAELLDSHGVVSQSELADGWERLVDEEAFSRDLTRRFRERTLRVVSQARHDGVNVDEVQRRLRMAELALTGNDAGQAIDRLADLAQIDPRNDELWSLLGETAFESGELEIAKIAFSRVLELRGAHFETLVYLGTVASDLGDFDEAEIALNQAMALAPTAFLPHFTLGALAAMRGDDVEAVRRLERAVSIDEAPQALYLLGVCRLRLEHPGKAIEAFRLAVDRAPEFEEAMYQLGVAYLRRGWTRRAMEAFQSVLSLDPQRLRYQETVRLLSVDDASPDLPEAAAQHVDRAENALLEDRPVRALDHFRRAVDAAPENPELRATTALLASEVGQPRVALRYAHGLLRSEDHESPYAAAAIVAVLETLRRVKRPRAAQRIALRLYRNGGSSLVRGMAAYEFALAGLEIGEDLVEARDMAREALDVTPRELRHFPLAALGAIAVARHRYREAVQYLEQAVETGPTREMLHQLAVARLGLGDREGAEAALEEAGAEPASGVATELLGHVRQLSGLMQSLK